MMSHCTILVHGRLRQQREILVCDCREVLRKVERAPEGGWPWRSQQSDAQKWFVKMPGCCKGLHLRLRRR
jgi:hypothetical protein